MVKVRKWMPLVSPFLVVCFAIVVLDVVGQYIRIRENIYVNGLIEPF
jgi:hypothetical protein